MPNSISANITQVEEQIAAAARRAGRDPDRVKLVPVTKSVGEGEVRSLIDLGRAELAENRVEVARPKIEAAGGNVRWHMVGHIQRRKARDVVALFDRVDSVDRLEIAEELEKRCEAAGKDLDVLVQVNVAREEAKGGFSPDELPEALRKIGEMPHLNVQGLMTMAPATDDPETIRPVFATLRALADENHLQECSMGMSGDFEVAVEEGATEVRIGTALFK